MTESYVLLSSLAEEWGIDKSNARKYALRHGFEFIQVRSHDRTHQLTLAMPIEQAELLRERRMREGYTNGISTPRAENGAGVFYVVQVVPDVDTSRIKLGYAVDSERRLAAYRTVSPTASIVKTWYCRASWERAAVDSLTAENCTSIGGEVYQCSDMQRLIERGDTFFACLPERRN